MDPTPARPRSGRPPRGRYRTERETSAGGLVIDTSGPHPRAAIIARINRAGRLEWCLPKGHLEGNETPEEAAVREVAEETGITGRIVGELGSIAYWFQVDNVRIHKTVHHFLMVMTGGRLTIDNDPECEAVDVKWVRVDELPRRLAFTNERRIAAAAGEALADIA